MGNLVVNTITHKMGTLALVATASISNVSSASAQLFGTEVVNVATVSYSHDNVDIRETLETNAAVFTIRPPEAPAVIEFFRNSPTAPSPIMRNINGTDFSPSGDLNGTFLDIGPATSAGGVSVKLGDELPLIPAARYLPGELIFVRVTDTGRNFNSNEIDLVEITISANNEISQQSSGNQSPSETGDVIVLRLYEADPDTGEFWGYLPSTALATNIHDEKLTVGENTQLTATYIDPFNQTDVTLDSAIVNPVNRVFSSVTGEAIDGAVITLINLDTGLEADVLGVDGFSTFPSEVSSGETVSDEGGLIYEVGAGQFRFPLLEAGRYAVKVDPPEGFRFASVVDENTLSNLNDGSFVILPATFGEEITLSDEDPLRFDIALDPETDLIVSKTADRTQAAIGDFVNYTVSVENTGSAPAPVSLNDTLPVGFRYIPGTARTLLNRIDDPEISSTATLLTFPMGVIQPGETITLDYALEIGPGATLGDAVNEAVVLDNNGDQLSNVARAGVRLREDLFRSTSTVVGRITEKSCSSDEEWARHVTRGLGVEGVRLYMETGAYVVSDSDGLFHFEGVTEGTHVVQVDKETLPQGYVLMECEDNTRYAGSISSQFVDVQGGGIWRANFYLKQVGEKAVVAEEEVFNDAKEYKKYDTSWLEGQTADIEWAYPDTTRTPSKPSTNLGIKHGAKQTVALELNGKAVSALNFAGRDGNADRSVMISRWRGVDLLEGGNKVTATISDANGKVLKTIHEEIFYVSNISRAIPLPDQSTLSADGRTPPVVAVRLEDEAGRPVHAGRIASIDLEPPYRLFDGTGENQLDLIAPLSARRDLSVGADGILKVKLEPTLRTGKVTLHVTLDNGRSVPIYMYLEPEKRDWILVGLAEGSAGYQDITGNAIALGESAGKDVVKDGRVAFFAKGLIKGNWLLTLSVDTDKTKTTTSQDGDFLGEIDPNAFYTLYGDRSYQEFEGASRFPVFVKLEKRQAYALFGDYDTDISEGRLTAYHRRLSGLKAEYIGDNIQVLGFGAETNQGFAKDEIAADGTSGTYQLSNERILAQSETIVIETRDRFRPDIIINRQTMVRFLDYTLDYFTGELIFRKPVDVSDIDFNPNVIVVDYETSEDAESNITFGGRVQAHLLNKKVRVGSTFVHEDGSSLAGGIEQNQIGVDIVAQVTDSTQIRAEYAITESVGTESDGTSDAILAEIIHTSENFSGEAYFREEEAGFGLEQTGSNTNSVRRYGVSGEFKVHEFEDKDTGQRGSRHIEAQAFREENLTTGNARNTGEILATHDGANLSLSAGLRASEDELVSGEDRQSITAIGRASLRVPSLNATVQLSHEQPLGGNDEVSAFPRRTTIGVDKPIGSKAVISARHEIIEGPNSADNNTSIGITASPWANTTVTANTDLLTNDSGRRLGATIGLDQQVRLTDKWSASLGARSRRVFDEQGEFFEVAPDDAISPLEINEDFESGYVGLAYTTDVTSASGRLEARRSSAGDTWTASTAVARELTQELSFAGSARGLFNDDSASGDTSSQLDIRLGGAWRPRDEDTIIFDRLDVSHRNNERGERETKIVNNLAVNTAVTDRLQATVNYGVKNVRTEIAGQNLQSWNHLLGGEARFDVTDRIDIGLRGSMMRSESTDTMQYSFGPSVGISPVKNVWVSAGYNFEGFRDDDFEAAEYSREGVYLQMRLKFDQDTARGLLRRISPRSVVNDVKQKGFGNP